MSNKNKLLIVLISISWFSLLVEVICLEAFNSDIYDVLFFIILSSIIFVLSLAYFIYKVFKEKPLIDKLRQEYLNKLKPNKPLRFCLPDDVLLKNYKSGKITEKDLSVLNSKKLSEFKNNVVARTNLDEDEYQI